MAWYDEPAHPFAGIAEKLARAKQNIFNLDSEISLFFQESDYPVVPENDRELLLKAVEYHRNLAIPPRFAVLAGEIIHHLRSCFDHIVWHFTILPIKNIRKLEFPIFDKSPANNDGRRLFEGKIAGITNPDAISLIKRLQPYNATNPLDDPLWIIHDFDIVDKHKELVICVSTGTRKLPIEMQSVMENYQRAHPELNRVQVANQFKNYGPIVPCISFRDFGGRDIQPVIPGLTNLFNYTVNAINGFAAI